MFRASRCVTTVAFAACLLPLAGCSQAQRTMDCITFAGKISNDIAGLQSVITDPSQSGNDLQTLQNDLGTAGGNLDSQDAKNSANALNATVTKLTAQVQSGQGMTIDDLDPLTAEALDLTKACKD